MPLSHLPPETDTPPDGDFASYVERLTQRGAEPGSMRRPVASRAPSASGARQAASGHHSGAANAASQQETWLQRLWRALQAASQAAEKHPRRK